jgi:ABC-2 type transport system ATP-binding protein
VSNPPILLQGVGVQYDLHLSRKRSIRKTVYRVTREKVESERKFWALRNINLTVAAGESIAVIGPNGAGKSTLLQTLAGIIPVTEGKIEVRGDIATLLHLGAGLEDELNAEDNVMLVGAFLGIPAATMRKKVKGILDFADLGKFARAEARTYSSGMRARLGFSIATSVEPDVLLLDEVLSTGDTSFRDKSRDRIVSMMKKARAIVYVTHDLESAAEFCSRAIELRKGEIVAEGPAKRIIADYQKRMAANPAAYPVGKPGRARGR